MYLCSSGQLLLYSNEYGKHIMHEEGRLETLTASPNRGYGLDQGRTRTEQVVLDESTNNYAVTSIQIDVEYSLLVASMMHTLYSVERSRTIIMLYKGKLNRLVKTTFSLSRVFTSRGPRHAFH
jgi:hypothetical protein